MDRDGLVRALEGMQIPEAAAEEYERKGQKMAGAVTERMLARDDLGGLIGEGNSEMMRDNHANHSRFIASILQNFDAQTLTDTVLWVFRAYRSRGFQDNYWAAQLNQWQEVLRENLSAENLKAVLPVYDWMQVNIPHFSAVAGEQARVIKDRLS